MDLLYDLSRNTHNTVQSLLALPYFVVKQQYVLMMSDPTVSKRG